MPIWYRARIDLLEFNDDTDPATVTVLRRETSHRLLDYAVVAELFDKAAALKATPK